MEASRGFVLREIESLEIGQLNAAKSKLHVSLRAVVHIGIPHSCVSGHVVKNFRLFVMCDIFWRRSRYVLCISGEHYIAKHQAWAGFHSWREVSLLGMGTEINGFKILIPKLFFQNHVKVVKSCVTRNEERVKPGFSSE